MAKNSYMRSRKIYYKKSYKEHKMLIKNDTKIYKGRKNLTNLLINMTQNLCNSLPLKVTKLIGH